MGFPKGNLGVELVLFDLVGRKGLSFCPHCRSANKGY